ncbi:MAG: EAL domain-containing protein [Clostridia bacterium]|nr:EAL domain-containing protein [Clostridia bacterium]
MPLNQNIYSILLAGTAGLLLAAVLLLVICNAKRKNLSNTAFLDPLTGGLTDRAFLARTGALLKGRVSSFAMVSVQAANLDQICVSFGTDEHPVSLNRMQAALKAQLGSEEISARTGEDSFCFLLKNRKPDEICARLERIWNVVNQTAQNATDGYLLELRFGIYLPESDERDPASIMGKAVQARLSGPVGRRYHFYDRGQWDATLMEREMAASMDHALQTSEFVVYYQPKVRVLDQRVAGAEALIRWRHPQRGLLSSDMFLPMAERYQKIGRIDRFVFENVCGTLARWKKQGRELCPISVNLARADLNQPNFADERYDICCKYGVDPANIEFEMKENLLLENLERAKSLIERFHALGFRCAVDNFGADATAMQLLGSLDLDTVKLDRSFFSGDNDNRRGRYIAEAILKVTSQLHIRTVAEGIASPGQAQFLQQVACDMIQGFYYFKPMSLEKFESEAWDRNVLKFVEPAVAPNQPVVKKPVAVQPSQNGKSIVLFSYLPQEDTVEFSEAFSPVLGGQTYFHNALALFRTTELIHENDREDFFRLLERCQREDGWVENTLRFYLAQGRYGWLEMHLHRDGPDVGSVISGTMINIAEWKNEVNRWKEKATRDALTGLYNREYFEHSAQTQLEQKIYSSAALMFIDVDDFKRVNDTFGHMFGDDVLCYVAKQILSVFRHTDVVARYGGDEFVVFAPSIQKDILEDRLKRLCGAFKFPYRGEQVEYKVSVTIGAAMYPDDGVGYEALLEHADCALYEAKKRGKDQFALYEPHMKGKND